MAYHAEIENEAAKALIRLARGDKASARRITAAVRSLAEDPRSAAATKLVGQDAWRLRVGDYRVVYLIEEAVLVVTITRIAHRREVYDR